MNSMFIIVDLKSESIVVANAAPGSDIVSSVPVEGASTGSRDGD